MNYVISDLVNSCMIGSQFYYNPEACMFLKEKHAHSSGTLISDLRDGREIGQREFKTSVFLSTFYLFIVFLNERQVQDKIGDTVICMYMNNCQLLILQVSLFIFKYALGSEWIECRKQISYVVLIF